jgi:hypothetical protein
MHAGDYRRSRTLAGSGLSCRVTVFVALLANAFMATLHAQEKVACGEPIVHVADVVGEISPRLPPFSEDSQRFVTVSDWPNCLIHICDLKTCKHLVRPIFQKAVIGRQLVAGGKTLFTYTGDREICLWDIETSTLRSRVAVEPELADAKCSPDGTRFLTKTGNPKRLRLWRAGDKKPFTQLDQPNPITFSTFDNSGARILTREWTDGTAFQLWDAKTGEDVGNAFESNFDALGDMSPVAVFAADGKQLALVQKRGFTIVDAGPLLSMEKATHQSGAFARNRAITPSGRQMPPSSLGVKTRGGPRNISELRPI